MAKYVEEVTHVWYKCKSCPFLEFWYQDDGFGMREGGGYSCKKGYFGKIKLYGVNFLRIREQVMKR